MLKKLVLMVILVVFFCSPVFAATAEEEAALNKSILVLSTKAMHEATQTETIEEKWLLKELVGDENDVIEEQSDVIVVIDCSK